MATEVCNGAGAHQYLALARQQFRALEALGQTSFNRRLTVGDATISLSHSPGGDRIMITAGGDDTFFRIRTGPDAYTYKRSGARGIGAKDDVSTTESGYAVFANQSNQWASGRFVIAALGVSGAGLYLGAYNAITIRVFDTVTYKYRDVVQFWCEINVAGVPYVSVAPIGQDDAGVPWIAVSALGPHPVDPATKRSLYVVKVKLSVEESTSSVMWPPVSHYDYNGGDNISEIDRGQIASIIVDGATGNLHLLKLNLFTGAYTTLDLNATFGEQFVAIYSGVVCPKKGTLVLGLYRYTFGDPNNRTVFYRSTDNGVSWSAISPEPPFDTFVYGSFHSVPLFSSYFENHVVYATGTTLVSSTDGGVSWTSGVMAAPFNPHYASPYLGGSTPVFYTYVTAPPAVQYGWGAANALGDVDVTMNVYKDHRLTEKAWDMPLGKANFDQVAYAGYIHEVVARHFGASCPLRPGHPGFLELSV